MEIILPPEPIIELRDVHLTLKSDAGPVNILRGIDLTVQPGETLGIVGPSGSGKSTLMSIMAGLEAPTSGTIRIAGAKIETMDEDALARFRRDNIGIVFQSFHLIPTMTALENIAIPLELGGRRDAFDLAREKLASVGLEERASHYPAQLSGGEQQRVALARALCTDPKILLADEPTGNLDGQTGERIVDLMFHLHAKQGTTMVLITHDEALASRCSHVIRIEDGRVSVAAPELEGTETSE